MSLDEVIRKLNGTAEAALEVQLPQGGEHYYYSNFPAYHGPLKEGLATVQQLLVTCEAMVRTRRAPPPDWTDADDVATWSSDLLDDVMEKLDGALDAERCRARGREPRRAEGAEGGAAAAGAPDDMALMANLPSFGGTAVRATRHKDMVRHAAGLARPQELFDPRPDNRREVPFRPRVDHLEGLTAEPCDPRVYLAAPGAPEDYPHPFAADLEALVYRPDQLQAPASKPRPPALPEESPLVWVDTPAALEAMVSELSTAEELAIDLEHHSHRSFLGFTCLMQISTRSTDYVVDTLALRNQLGPALARVFADPRVVKVLHGADSDVEWLQRDFGLFLVNMFDTGQAARVLALPSFGLAHLMESLCGVAPDKRYQMADWRVRPLSEQMLHYARCDTHYLLYVYDKLREQLAALPAERIAPSLVVPLPGSNPGGGLGLVLERSRQLCLKTYRKPAFSATGYQELLLKWNLILSPQQTAVFAALLEWRDRVCRAEDESSGYVLSKAQLVALAQAMPEGAKRIQSVLGRAMSEVAVRRIGELIAVINDARHCKPPQPVAAPGTAPAATAPAAAAKPAAAAVAAPPPRPALPALKPRAVAPIRTAAAKTAAAVAATAMLAAPAASTAVASPADTSTTPPGEAAASVAVPETRDGPAATGEQAGAAGVSGSADAAGRDAGAAAGEETGPGPGAGAAAPAAASAAGGGLKPRALKPPPIRSAVSRSAALFGGGGGGAAAANAATSAAEATAAVPPPGPSEASPSAGEAVAAEEVAAASGATGAAAPPAKPPALRPSAAAVRLTQRPGGTSLMGALFGGGGAGVSSSTAAPAAKPAAADNDGDDADEERLARQRAKRLRATFELPFLTAPAAAAAGAAAGAAAATAATVRERAAAFDVDGDADIGVESTTNGGAPQPKRTKPSATAADIRAAVEAMRAEGDDVEIVLGADGQREAEATATGAAPRRTAAAGGGGGGGADGGPAAGDAGSTGREAPGVRSVAMSDDEDEEGEADGGEEGAGRDDGGGDDGAGGGDGAGGVERRVAGAELGLDILEYVPVPLSQMGRRDKGGKGKKRQSGGAEDGGPAAGGGGGGAAAAGPRKRRFTTEVPTAAAAGGSGGAADEYDDDGSDSDGSGSDGGHTVGPFAKKRKPKQQKAALKKGQQEQEQQQQQQQQQQGRGAAEAEAAAVAAADPSPGALWRTSRGPTWHPQLRRRGRRDVPATGAGAAAAAAATAAGAAAGGSRRRLTRTTFRTNF